MEAQSSMQRPQARAELLTTLSHQPENRLREAWVLFRETLDARHEVSVDAQVAASPREEKDEPEERNEEVRPVPLAPGLAIREIEIDADNADQNTAETTA